MTRKEKRIQKALGVFVPFDVPDWMTLKGMTIIVIGSIFWVVVALIIKHVGNI